MVTLPVASVTELNEELELLKAEVRRRGWEERGRLQLLVGVLLAIVRADMLFRAHGQGVLQCLLELDNGLLREKEEREGEREDEREGEGGDWLQRRLESARDTVQAWLNGHRYANTEFGNGQDNVPTKADFLRTLPPPSSSSSSHLPPSISGGTYLPPSFFLSSAPSLPPSLSRGASNPFDLDRLSEEESEELSPDSTPLGSAAPSNPQWKLFDD